ncbi:MAG: amino acid adenylation domain-containing protein [Clostridia bacterium]|nr:amino acid adenylation domain-containing protein [Clostridia bacterium]
MSDKKLYELTEQQQGMWYTEKLYPNTSMGSITGIIKIKDTINFEVLEKAINKFVEKNDAMRLIITEENGNPMQYVSDFKYSKLKFIDFSKKDTKDLYEWEENEAKKAFDIHNSLLFEFVMFKAANEGGFVIRVHHIISDAWSLVNLSSKVIENYIKMKNNAYAEENNAPSYIDFINSEKEYLASKRFNLDKKYWEDKLSIFEDITTLKENKSDNTSIKSKRKTFVLPEKLSNKIREFCKEKKVSEYTLFIAAISMYINRTRNKEDMFFGTSLLNRSTKAEKETMGMFVNAAVPVHVKVNGESNFDDFIESISKELLSTLKHQKYPYSEMTKFTKKTKLFDIVLNYQNAKLNHKLDLDYLTRWVVNDSQIESLIVNVNDRDGEGNLIIDYDYLTDLFYAKEVDFIHQHIINILWHALDNCKKPIADLEMLSEVEKDKILHKFNDDNATYDHNITIHEIFEKQVEKYPNNIALTFDGKNMTYKELNEKANALAHILRKNGLKREDIVCMILDKSFNTIISILAILKSGGAYLPILPDYPTERIDFMLADSGSKFLITQKEYKGKYKFDGLILCADDEKIYNEDKTNLPNVNKPEDLLYIIYTSGSTGKPKGVMLEHRNVVRLLYNSAFQFDFNDKDVWTMFHSYCFDFSVWEMYGALLYGGRLVIIPKEISRDVQEFLKVLRKEKVTILNQTPNVFYNLVNEEVKEKNADLVIRYIVFGGEALKPTMLKPFRDKYPKTKLINMYGITETTVHVTFKDLSDEDIASSKSNIGKPIPTLKTYIMDKNLKLLPVNTPGEICVTGAGVARGYLNRPELTKEKFVVNPYNPTERMYRSGDLGRYYAEGDIEYLGRIDNQVKIRGFRVELDEIERTILTFDGAKNALVMAKKDNNEKNFLCAYVVKTKDIDVQKLREHLAKTLPDYMVPAYYVFLDAFPLTVNGKIDRKNLPEPEAVDNTIYIAPVTETEKILASTFAEVLNKEKVGTDDNLFHIGGDSLTVIQLLTRLYKYNFKLTAADFYEYPTIKLLASKIDGEVKKEKKVSSKEEILKPLPYKEVSKIEPQKLSGNVLLTGATGFLGSHILKELLDTTDSTMYCLIRSNKEKSSLERLKDTMKFYFKDKINYNRIKVLDGDITEDYLGLSEKEYDELGKDIRTIIHTAALVKYYGDYSDFERINVGGVANVIKLAKKYDIKLNHISTIGISGSYLVDCDKKGLILTEKDLFVGQNYKENVYVHSKFEAEKLIIQEEKNGLKATVFRMGNLTGRNSDGQFQKNMNDNAFNNIIKTVVLLKTVPESLMDTDVEFTPVDLAAKSLLKIAATKESTNRIFHITNFKEIKFNVVMEMLKKMSLNLTVLSNDEFKNFVTKVSENNDKNKYLVGIIPDMSNSKDLTYDVPVKVHCEITESFLKLLGFEWPDIDYTYVEKVIKHLQDRHFFE